MPLTRIQSLGITDGTIVNADINASAAIAGTKLSAGAVLQVVSTAKTDTFSSSTGSYIDITGLSVSITPSSTSNKILILSDIRFSTNAAACFAFFKLVRGSTDIYLGDVDGSRSRGFGGGIVADSATTTQVSSVFLDSPSTTSSTTYKIQIYNQNAASFTIYVNRPYSDANNASYLRATSSITALEIKG